MELLRGSVLACWTSPWSRMERRDLIGYVRFKSDVWAGGFALIHLSQQRSAMMRVIMRRYNRARQAWVWVADEESVEVARVAELEGSAA